MSRTLRHTLIVAAALSLLAISCADTEAEAPVTQEVETRAQTVTVVPTFSIAGISSLPADLHLSELGFVISEIRLEPLAGNAGSVAFSAVKPEIVKYYQLLDKLPKECAENIAWKNAELEYFKDWEIPTEGRYAKIEPTYDCECLYNYQGLFVKTGEKY